MHAKYDKIEKKYLVYFVVMVTPRQYLIEHPITHESEMFFLTLFFIAHYEKEKKIESNSVF